MTRIINTSKDIEMGPFIFPDRKKPALAIREGNKIKVYGYFNTKEGAGEFMERLAKALHMEWEDEDDT